MNYQNVSYMQLLKYVKNNLFGFESIFGINFLLRFLILIKILGMVSSMGTANTLFFSICIVLICFFSLFGLFSILIIFPSGLRSLLFLLI